MNPRVEKFCVSINCENASLEEVEEAEAAARYAVDVHPNCPTLELVRYGEDNMVLPNPQQQVNTPHVLVQFCCICNYFTATLACLSCSYFQPTCMI